MDIEKLLSFANKIFTLEIESEDSNIIIYKYHEYKVEVNKPHIEELLEQLQNTYQKDETELYTDKYYEILTINSSRIYYPRNRFEETRDNVNGLTYYHGTPSDSYIVYILEILLNLQGELRAKRYFDSLRFRRLRRIKQPEDYTAIPILTLLGESIRGLSTIKILSTKNVPKVNFEQYSYSYIFNLSYNLNYIIYPIKYFDEFFSPLRAEAIRRTTDSNLEPPRRTYINDLILHYQKALSSESFDNQFLSFYHIIEYFFEKIYNEDLQINVRNELTKPSFSYKKKSDIENLIKIVQSRTKILKDEFQVNELEALELTLKKFLTDINYLESELNQLPNNLIQYYKSTEVAFSKGNRVNFELSDEEVFKSLAKRIYYTRNSIVHSKETDKRKYTPFKDDKDLLPEIYLMRIITEIILINNSKEI